MTFSNDKKTFLAKEDHSKKGSIDQKVISLIEVINKSQHLYTTSSCSGRIYLWRGTEVKTEMEWLKVSHDLITKDFFDTVEDGFIWLRLEPFILHVCCKDLETASEFVEAARTIFKKSCILTVSKRIVVEIRGSEYIEMPFQQDGKLLYAGNLSELQKMINAKLKKNFDNVNRLESVLKKII